MQNTKANQFLICSISLIAAIGWIWALKLHADAGKSRETRNESVATSSRKRSRAEVSTTSTQSLAKLASSSRSAKLFADLAGIAASAKAGEPNEALLAACEQTMRDPDFVRRSRDFCLLLEIMRPEDAVRMHENFVAMHQEGRDFGMEYGAFATRWGEVDPSGALDYFLQENPVKLPNYDMEKIARSWGTADPESALRWMDEHPEIATSKDGWSSVLKGWFRTDPDTATKYLFSKDLPPRQILETTRYAFVEKLFSSGLDDAATWLAGIEDQGIGHSAALHAWGDSMSHLTELSPEKAASAWGKVGDQPWMRFGNFVSFDNMVTKGGSNQQAAVAFLNGLQDNWPIDQAAAQFKRWYEMDQNAVTNWLGKAPETEFSNAMREAVANP